MTAKWRIVKRSGMWLVRTPLGAHFGSFFTWREAVAQVYARRSVQRSGTGGDFSRMANYAYDSRIHGQAFGFVGPIRADGTGRAS